MTYKDTRPDLDPEESTDRCQYCRRPVYWTMDSTKANGGAWTHWGTGYPCADGEHEARVLA